MAECPVSNYTVHVVRDCSSYHLRPFIVTVSEHGLVHASRVAAGILLKWRLRRRVRWARHQLKAMSLVVKA